MIPVVVCCILVTSLLYHTVIVFHHQGIVLHCIIILFHCVLLSFEKRKRSIIYIIPNCFHKTNETIGVYYTILWVPKIKHKLLDLERLQHSSSLMAIGAVSWVSLCSPNHRQNCLHLRLCKETVKESRILRQVPRSFRETTMMKVRHQLPWQHTDCCLSHRQIFTSQIFSDRGQVMTYCLVVSYV